MIQIEAIDTNGNVISKDGGQLYNNTLTFRMYSVYDKPITKAIWTFDSEEIKVIENKSNFYNKEHRFFTKKTGAKTIQLDLTYLDETTDSKTLDIILINLPS